jgi:hypothetical protein
MTSHGFVSDYPDDEVSVSEEEHNSHQSQDCSEVRPMNNFWVNNCREFVKFSSSKPHSVSTTRQNTCDISSSLTKKQQNTTTEASSLKRRLSFDDVKAKGVGMRPSMKRRYSSTDISFVKTNALWIKPLAFKIPQHDGTPASIGLALQHSPVDSEHIDTEATLPDSCLTQQLAHDHTSHECTNQLFGHDLSQIGGCNLPLHSVTTVAPPDDTAFRIENSLYGDEQRRNNRTDDNAQQFSIEGGTCVGPHSASDAGVKSSMLKGMALSECTLTAEQFTQKSAQEYTMMEDKPLDAYHEPELVLHSCKIQTKDVETQAFIPHASSEESTHAVGVETMSEAVELAGQTDCKSEFDAEEIRVQTIHDDVEVTGQPGCKTGNDEYSLTTIPKSKVLGRNMPSEFDAEADFLQPTKEEGDSDLCKSNYSNDIFSNELSSSLVVERAGMSIVVAARALEEYQHERRPSQTPLLHGQNQRIPSIKRANPMNASESAGLTTSDVAERLRDGDAARNLNLTPAEKTLETYADTELKGSWSRFGEAAASVASNLAQLASPMLHEASSLVLELSSNYPIQHDASMCAANQRIDVSVAARIENLQHGPFNDKDEPKLPLYDNAYANGASIQFEQSDGCCGSDTTRMSKPNVAVSQPETLESSWRRFALVAVASTRNVVKSAGPVILEAGYLVNAFVKSPTNVTDPTTVEDVEYPYSLTTNESLNWMQLPSDSESSLTTQTETSRVLDSKTLQLDTEAPGGTIGVNSLSLSSASSESNTRAQTDRLLAPEHRHVATCEKPLFGDKNYERDNNTVDRPPLLPSDKDESLLEKGFNKVSYQDILLDKSKKSSQWLRAPPETYFEFDNSVFDILSAATSSTSSMGSPPVPDFDYLVSLYEDSEFGSLDGNEASVLPKEKINILQKAFWETVVIQRKDIPGASPDLHRIEDQPAECVVMPTLPVSISVMNSEVGDSTASERRRSFQNLGALPSRSILNTGSISISRSLGGLGKSLRCFRPQKTLVCATFPASENESVMEWGMTSFAGFSSGMNGPSKAYISRHKSTRSEISSNSSVRQRGFPIKRLSLSRKVIVRRPSRTEISAFQTESRTMRLSLSKDDRWGESGSCSLEALPALDSAKTLFPVLKRCASFPSFGENRTVSSISRKESFQSFRMISKSESVLSLVDASLSQSASYHSLLLSPHLPASVYPQMTRQCNPPSTLINTRDVVYRGIDTSSARPCTDFSIDSQSSTGVADLQYCHDDEDEQSLIFLPVDEELKLEEALFKFSSVGEIVFDFVREGSIEEVEKNVAIRWQQVVAVWKHSEVIRFISRAATPLPLLNTISNREGFDLSMDSSAPCALLRTAELCDLFSNITNAPTVMNTLDRFEPNLTGGSPAYLSIFLRSLRSFMPRAGVLRQRNKSFSKGRTTELLQAAKQHETELYALLCKLVSFAEGENIGAWEESDRINFSLGLKSFDSIEKKAKRKYDGDVLQVKDILRASIIYPTEATLVCGLVYLRLKHSTIAEDGTRIDIVRFKNMFSDGENLPTGYRHVLVNIRLNGGFLAGTFPWSHRTITRAVIPTPSFLSQKYK